MSDFNSPVDIANRALQHCGAKRIAAFTDNSKNASEVSFCYDKLRVAELRRNVWRFAVRTVALRAIDTTTKLLAPAAWSNATTYDAGFVVSYGDELWESQVASNLNHTPGDDAAYWDVYAGPMMISAAVQETGGLTLDTAYFSGELIVGDGGADTTTVYRSLTSSNDDIPPTANWLSLGTVSADLAILYPVGSGPVSQSPTRNVYQLPNGFLREAPLNPREGSTSFLGAPSGLTYTDHVLEENYIVTNDVDPILLRFVRDVTRVKTMDPMFCEGLACRIALEVCETLTQSTTKLNAIGSTYNRFMFEARAVNGIETGATEPPIDDYIACRV